MRILAIDPGTKRIGLALSNSDETLATPLATVRAGKQALPDIFRYIKEHGVEHIVVGLPLTSTGHTGDAAKRAEAFARKLEKKSALPVSLYNEAFTTTEARDRLSDVEGSGFVNKDKLDALAAAVILEDFLAFRKKSHA